MAPEARGCKWSRARLLFLDGQTLGKTLVVSGFLKKPKSAQKGLEPLNYKLGSVNWINVTDNIDWGSIKNHTSTKSIKNWESANEQKIVTRNQIVSYLRDLFYLYQSRELLPGATTFMPATLSLNAFVKSSSYCSAYRPLGTQVKLQSRKDLCVVIWSFKLLPSTTYITAITY